MTDYSKRGEAETATYRLFGEYFSNEANWSAGKAAVAAVFKAMYYGALTIEKINRIGNAITGVREDADLTDAVKELQRAKVLRSRRVGRITFFEANY
jgi:hypothetical protein